MNQSSGADDAARVTDTMLVDRGVRLDDLSGMHGNLIIERFTPPSDVDVNRPKQIGALIAGLRRTEMPQAEIDARIVDLQAELDDMLVERELTHNLITQVGDQYYGERASGIAGAPAQATGMKLGIGSTAVAKTGAGAALVTYQTASNVAIDGTWPQSSLSGASRRIQWKTSYGAGIVNGVALREVVIVNDSGVNATSSAANTYSRALFGPMTLGVSDTLAVTWNHDLLGA